MPYRIAHVQEALITLVLAIHAGAIHLMLAANSQPEAEALKWSLLPLMGALIASATAFLLNRDREVGRIVAGRTVFALVGGVFVPKLSSLIHPAVANIITDPLVLVLFGVVSALPCYFLAKPVIERLSKKSESTADVLIDSAMNVASRRLKNAGLISPADSKWPVPPEPGSPEHQAHQDYIRAEQERMDQETKHSNTPPKLP